MHLYWNVDQQKWIEQVDLSASDRALNYGDGLFETIRFNKIGVAPLKEFHLLRLKQGLQALQFPAALFEQIEWALKQLPKHARASAGKLLVSRGDGERGYATSGLIKPRLIWYAFTAPSWAIERYPDGFTVTLSTIQLSQQPLLAGIKHLNRLEQVLARAAFPSNCQEVVMCDQKNNVIEGCMSNIFAFYDGRWRTPNLEFSGVDGVIRRWALANEHFLVEDISFDKLKEAEALFFCNTLNGIIPVRTLDGKNFDVNHPAWQQALKLQHQLRMLF